MTQSKPKIAVLATGGTIASSNDNALATTGYTAGTLSIDALINIIPQIKNIAEISSIQIANIDSSNMSNEIWLKIAKAIDRLFKDGTDAILITHGTDTIEETAYFLNLVIKWDKPVILLGAMRPTSAIGSDGAKNLYNAFLLATNKQSYGKGVLLTMNDKIFSARAVVKTHSLNLEAFSSPNFGELGYIIDENIIFYSTITKAHTKATPFDVRNLKKLPKVDILYTYSNDGSAVAAKALFDNGTKGLVIAGSGAGNIHKAHKDVLKTLLIRGLKVVVSSRVLAGEVVLSSDDKALGFINAGNLNPQKARVLLMLALTYTNDTQSIQAFFDKY